MDPKCISTVCHIDSSYLDPHMHPVSILFITPIINYDSTVVP